MQTPQTNGTAADASKEDLILQALARIETRLDRLETQVQPAVELVGDVPDLLAATGDIVDDWARRKGDVDERLRNALSLLDRITNPKTMARLEQAVETVDSLPELVATVGDIADSTVARIPDFDQRLRKTLCVLDSLTQGDALVQLEQAVSTLRDLPALVATTGDIVDSTIARIPDFDARLRATLALVEKASDPEMLAHVGKALDILSDAPNLIATTGDIFDSWAAKATASGVDMGRIVEVLQQAAEGAMRLATSPELQRLLDSAVLRAETVDAISAAADSIAAAQDQAAPRLGAFGMWKALGDPDVQSALGFAVIFAKAFGKTRKAPNQLSS